MPSSMLFPDSRGDASVPSRIQQNTRNFSNMVGLFCMQLLEPDRLFDVEVVEAFFLNDAGDYLELEFGPHGQHLMLLLSGRRNAIK